MQVRCRFAPSPTGHLHIGSARTALFNWLFARHNQGKFLMRIEDTDPERSKEEFTTAILDGMRWLGMDWDGEPVYQSQRNELYQKHVDRLLEEGKAYYCSCTAAQVNEMRELALKEKRNPKYDGRCRDKTEHSEGLAKVVRFRCPQEGRTTVEDMIQGEVVFDNRELDDLIIQRSDGSFTYNFCAVVDDNDLGITHIIRGADHLSNTPKQIQLYQALGLELPRFAHHPLILGPDKAKLSKRHGATSLVAYRDMGYLPQAMMNFLARIGWSHGDQEIFSREELIELFGMDNLTRAPGIWNPEKLLWTNGHYIREASIDELAELALPFFKEKGYAAEPGDYFNSIIAGYQERAKTIVDFAESSGYFYSEEVEYQEKAKKKFLKPQTAELLEPLLERLRELPEFDEASLDKAFEEVMELKEVKMGKVAQPVRVAVTGGTVSPGIHEVLIALGKERVIKRLEKAIQVAKG